ncbi:PfkB family carbohydrate kinase [Arthrobacter bambusae]|uniref:PfkB family carbohydrate kinase n=1 Tax=Arthrobacter bambusae TaxID=1338426 RepID=UPI0027804C0C|nr:PfkB family carbohydrate kinase [Arthrobacter bambusae]MDQ0028580.1 rfaE bifunctional protein nucleotidyltransferase chain/domain/rfaE bifunctional protein kinase chain/domain [Arthrobacter bambusae]MDQ0096626.1 rfaE bifunctional protein nucleotidyltransferase chain/domain/rfaE bifunctional protein kinase chain/domain [Arthrobacter bambusae]
MRIVVVGDVLLDVDVIGEASRLSPDAPVPVVDVSKEEARAGGAGLVARMLANEDHRTTLVTVLADDEPARRLHETLGGIRMVAGPSKAQTPVKTRVRANGQSIVRFDHGWRKPPMPEVSDAMLREVAEADAVVVADYGRGLAANHRLRSLLESMADTAHIVWDPHPAGAPPVSGVSVVTPNLAEATLMASSFAAATGLPGNRPAALASALLDHWSSQAVVVTLGSQGALFMDRRSRSPLSIPVPSAIPGDTCGAGDKLAASLVARLAEGLGTEEAVVVAVNDAAEYLRAGGVGALARSFPSTFPTEADALALARRIRSRGGTVVATGGCFELLHAGHVRSLTAARSLGDCLIVCLNSDDSVRRIKGEQRPIMMQEDRKELLLAMECVDAVLVFDEDTPAACLDMLRPDLWVKGGDYDAAQLPERELVESWGGSCTTVPYYPARSSSHFAAALDRVG